MSKNNKDSEYLFLSAYLRAKELKMLDSSRINRMLETGDDAEAAKILAECGYGECESLTSDSLDILIAERRKQVYLDLQQLAPDVKVIDTFLIKNDYHNVKVLVKAEGADIDGGTLLLPCGRISPTIISEAFLQDNYSGLPHTLARSMATARIMLSETGNPQLVDFYLDRECYIEILSTARDTGSDFLIDYIRLTIDCANLRSAVRSARLKKDAAFLRSALIPGGKIDVNALSSADITSEAFLSLYSTSQLFQAAEIGAECIHDGNLTKFELFCDNALISYLKKAKLISFGVEPLVGYLGAIEFELMAVRIILSGRLSKLPSEQIKQRLRNTYV